MFVRRNSGLGLGLAIILTAITIYVLMALAAIYDSRHQASHVQGAATQMQVELDTAQRAIVVERTLAPDQLPEAILYLQMHFVAAMPAGWEPAIVAKKLWTAPGGSAKITIQLADGSQRVLEGAAHLAGPIAPPAVQEHPSTSDVDALLDVGDYLVVDPTAFNHRRDHPVWVLATGHYRIVQKFALRPIEPAR